MLVPSQTGCKAMGGFYEPIRIMSRGDGEIPETGPVAGVAGATGGPGRAGFFTFAAARWQDLGTYAAPRSHMGAAGGTDMG